ncbi:alpha-(1,3)-fucosyltransferase B isoform X2 [Drosophila bipectinata]|nr:alpha-(1,3)-fucosyltransferase B isoform X2 [Drosophila bipectinata]
MIAIENAACPDYITEKFWRPLVMGVVPIYFGSPTIKYWEPNKKSAIYVDDFPHPRALAKYLHEVADNETEYDSYRFHKINWQSPIKNNNLNYNLLTRRYHIGDTSPGGSLFERFECSVCRYVITTARNVRADIAHYDCPIEPIYAHLESQQEPENVGDWRSMMQVGKCQAKILDTFFRRNYSYTRADFDAELNRRMDKSDCAP